MKYLLLVRKYGGAWELEDIYHSQLEAERAAGEQVAQGFYAQVWAGDMLSIPASDEWARELSETSRSSTRC